MVAVEEVDDGRKDDDEKVSDRQAVYAKVDVARQV